MKKKILIIDDSALMRRVLSDIINSDDRFEVVDTANDGAEGFKYLAAKSYDAVVLDVYMPRMTGLEMLREMLRSKVYANVLMASTTTGEGAKETLEALELGAVDFIKKPENVAFAREDDFRHRFLSILEAVAMANPRHMALAAKNLDTDSALKPRTFTMRYDVNFHNVTDAVGSAGKASGKSSPVVRNNISAVHGKKIVAIASSTGGPKALQEVIPYLPANLNAPVLLVQHMPKGFTKSLADRLDELSKIEVSEAVVGESIKKGHVYIAPGGLHLKSVRRPGGYNINCTDEPAREGVKPCANFMYESLADSDYDEIVCVVLTGMGSDGTAGIKELKKTKNIHVIAQDEVTSMVYGMPRAIAQAGIVDEVLPLSAIAEAIIKNVGVY